MTDTNLSFEQLMEEIELDSKINQGNLENEIARCLGLTVKYMRYHRIFKEKLVKMWSSRSAKELERQEYYAGRAPTDAYRAEPFNLEVRNATEMKRWIESDPELSKMNEIISLTEDCMEKIESMLESLKYRPNHIQTILEIRKFESGV